MATDIQALLDTPSKVVILRLKKKGFKPLKVSDSKKALKEIEKDLLRWSKLVLSVVNDSIPKETEKLNPEVDLEEAEKEEVISSMFKPMSPTRVNELATSSSKRVAKLLGDQVNSQISRANRIAQEGLKRGDNLTAVTKRIEKATGFTEGVSNRFARTTTMSMLNQGLDELYQDNRDSILGVRHISTLDSRTCMVCGSLDGREYYQGTSEKGEKTGGSDDFGDRPALPIHASCRCVYVPLSKFWLRAMIATGKNVKASNLRASSFGAKNKLDWSGWLKKTDKSDSKTVQSILGQKRYKLWKENGVPPEKFINLKSLSPVSLDVLAKDLIDNQFIEKSTASAIGVTPPIISTTVEEAEKNIREFKSKLTEDEKRVVKDYTLAGGKAKFAKFRTINSYLRGEGIVSRIGTQKLKDSIAFLKDVLKRAPVYHGEVWRWVKLSNEKEYKNFLKTVTENSEMEMKAFTSSSTKKSISEYFGGSKYSVIFKIQSKSGVYLGDLSALTSESEVLFLPGTTFKIKTIEQMAYRGKFGKRLIIELEEA